ncbi:MAG: transglutaminase-like domain-containing protein [Akkermansiaceae bacterium]
MKRGWIMIPALLAAYLALRVWPSGNGALYASILLITAWWLLFGPVHARRLNCFSMSLLAAVLLSSGGVIALFFLHAPAALEEASEQVMLVLSSNAQKQKKSIEQHINQNKPRSGNWLWNEQTIRPLPRRANLKPGNQPEVFLQLQNPAKVRPLIQRRAYISAFALGTYHDAAWSLTPPDTANPPSFARRPGDLFEYEIFHPSDPSGQTPIVALQGMLDAEITPLSYRGDGILILPPSDTAIGYRYRARSQPLSIDDLDDLATAAPRTMVPAPWLELPDDETLLIGIRGLNAEMITAGSMKQRLIQLREGLRQECEYSLDIANPDNRDPLENFLFHEKRGHCELFATAGALAARAIGVPSRVAYGWAGGSYYENSNLFVFRAREAHAWTEVLIEGTGWVVLDCTPPASIGNSRAAPPDEKPVSAEDAAEMQQEEDATQADAAKVSLALGILTAMSSTVLIVLWSLKNRRLEGVSDTGSRHVHEMGYYRYFLMFCQKRGVPVTKHLTLRQILRKFTPALPFANALERYHYRVRYGQQNADSKSESALKEQIRKEIS